MFFYCTYFSNIVGTVVKCRFPYKTYSTVLYIINKFWHKIANINEVFIAKTIKDIWPSTLKASRECTLSYIHNINNL